MKNKFKLDIIYSSISIFDAIITLTFFLSTCDYVIKNVPDDFFGFLYITIYACICLLSCVFRNLYLLKKYFREIEKINSKKSLNKEQKHSFPIYLLPLFSIISCLLSLVVVLF